MDHGRVHRVRRIGPIPWRQALTVLCGLAVVTAMITVADAAQQTAARHQRVLVLVQRLGSVSHALAALTWQSVAEEEAAGARLQRLQDPQLVTEATTAWRQLSMSVHDLRAADRTPTTLAVLRRSEALQAAGSQLLAAFQGGLLIDGVTRLHVELLPKLSALDDVSATAISAQERVANQGLARARLAYFASLAIGLTVLLLLGIRLHRMRRAAGLTEARRALERRSERRIRALVEHSSDVITVVGRDLVVRWQSPSVRRTLGHEPDAMLGRSLAGLVHPDDVVIVEGHVAQADAQRASTFIARFRDGSGSWRHLEAIVQNRLDDPVVQGVILSLRDISERQALEQELRHQAFHDGLTGLANRALFEDRLTHALAGARRHGRPVAVLFLDLDDFKTINDSLGHAVGDELLRAAARRIATEIRVTDTAARLGGDEFAVLLEVMDDESDADVIAQRLLEAVRAPVEIDGRELRVSASIGLARSDGSTGVEDLLRNADTAMYAAKDAGKGTTQTFEAGMHQRVLDRLELTGELQQAITREQFELDYQPIVELDTGRIVGAEALVRWAHPERGRLAPGHFIALAEETGMIVALGAWILRTACWQAAAWHRELPERCVYMTVNVSTRQLHDPAFPGVVADALAQSGLPGSKLVLEITESLLPEDGREMVAHLTALKHLGVRVAVDDFGSGYSALSRLQAYPVDILKIDRSFIDGLARDPSKGQLVQGIVNLAQSLHLEIVAEGIEEPEQADQLRQMRSPLGQGFLFSRPIGSEPMGALLRGGQRLDAGVVAPSL
jgi:diguanylate cyclase (GGDEF)-like protein/PAS domain S-box-containing protein